VRIGIPWYGGLLDARWALDGRFERYTTAQAEGSSTPGFDAAP